MEQFLAYLLMLGLLNPLPECSCTTEFQLRGKYLLGGLFDVHTASNDIVHNLPIDLDCSKQPFTLSSYRRLQVMRFAVEEINNSTLILPNVTLGYELLDFCSNVLNLPTVLDFISRNGSIDIDDKEEYLSKIIGIIGPYGSEDTIIIAPLFMMHLIPMVNYGATCSALSETEKYPSFLRTVPSNNVTIELIVSILKHFNWRWVAFLSSHDTYSNDGLELFKSKIKNTDICLAYSEEVNEKSNLDNMFKIIESLGINVIIVFTVSNEGELIVQSAISNNIQNKVWIAGDDWSLDDKIPKLSGIENIGTVIGVTLTDVTLPGFREFVYNSQNQIQCTDCAPISSGRFCRHACNECTTVRSEQMVTEDASHNFAVYSSIYAVAHALHNVLECSPKGCNNNVTVYPFMLLKELKKVNFTLLSQNVQFDENGDQLSSSFEIIFWKSGFPVKFGIYETYPKVQLYINDSAIEWHTNGSVPLSQCSPDCVEGFMRQQSESSKCCFECEMCPGDTYVNKSVNMYRCLSCGKTQWSDPGSVVCLERTVDYITYTEPLAILILVLTSLMLALSLGVAILFALNFNTPVVKSAGGPMCFLMLACLGIASLNVFFYLGEPTEITCFLMVLFVLLYTVCIACFGVRSFQIVCIFKMAAKFPMMHRWWTKYNGQWLVIVLTFISQTVLIMIGYAVQRPKPYNDTTTYKDHIIIKCNIFNMGAQGISSFFLGVLCILCFTFSYMGKNLPKNYNEAKAITFSLLLLIFTWITYTTATMLYTGKYVQALNALSVISSLYCILLWYFLPKCYIIIFQPQKNTQQHFQGLIQSYTKNISK